MSQRSEIIDGKKAAVFNRGLVYTEMLGWIDLRHAQGMTASYGLVRSGKVMTWRLRHGRPYSEQKSIALAMMMAMARQFETFQSSFPNNLVTDSGFSGEDLVSDLPGFYRVVSEQNPFPLLRPVSKAEALKRWDYYGKIGNWKNDTFQPLLFPDPEKFPHAKPRMGVLPQFMKTVTPYSNFSPGNVIRSRNDKTFVVLGADNGRMGL